MVSITRSAQPLAGLKQNRSIQDEKLVESIFQTGDDLRTLKNYRGCKILFSGIENIHVMRDSLSKLMEAIQSSESGSALRSSMDKSGWLKHVKAVMDGAIMIVQNIHLLNNPVLVHCSDGWDRTAQLCSLSEMCLDPFYRTMKGFQVLIEKEWASFGFKFRDRLGLLTKENREGGDRPSVGAQIQAASKNVGFSITSAAKNLLTKTGAGGSSSSNVSSYSTSYYPSSNGGYPSSNPYGASSGPQGSAEITTPNTIHPKEVSPVFTQFLDCAYQLWTQFPTHFEFNEKFLIAINTHIYSCQFGNFLFNCERERLSFTYRQPGGPTVPLDRATNSIWDYFDANKDEYLNPGAGTGAVGIGASLGAPGSISEDGDVLFPSSSNPRYWVGMLFKGEEDYVDTEISNPGLEPGAGGSSSSTSTRYGSTSGPSRSARTSSIARASSTSLSQTYINTDRDQVPSATPAVTGTSGQKLFPPSNTQQWSSTPSANPRSLATDEPDIMSTPATSAHIGNSMVESITMGMNSLAGSVKTFAANVDFNPWNMGGSGASRPPSSADTYRTDDGVNMVDPKTLMVAPIGEDKTTVGGLSSIERKLEELSLARAAAKRDAATSATASWEQTDAAKQEQPDEERRKERPMEVVSLDESTVDGDEFTEEVLVAAGGNIVEVSATTPVQKPMQITNMPHPLWIP
ncbi:protein-tyrosine phosphatase-like protein [Chytridium lagenaria]|nr:protein-tyrosine phosphatase-like protein [Chytridium lagenaria]